MAGAARRCVNLQLRTKGHLLRGLLQAARTRALSPVAPQAPSFREVRDSGWGISRFGDEIPVFQLESRISGREAGTTAFFSRSG